MKLQNSIVLILVSFICFSQNQSNIRLGVSEQNNLSFYEYVPRLKIKATMNSMADTKNQYPEELMTSILSATNQKWVNYNNIKEGKPKPPSHFEKIRTMNKEENYFELHHKLSLKLGGIPTTLIKFYFHQENQQPVSGCYVMQKSEGRWKRTANVNLSLLSIIIMRLKSNVLEGIILENSKDEYIMDLRDKVTDNNGMLDIKSLETEFLSWYDPQRNEILINLFIDKNAW